MFSTLDVCIAFSRHGFSVFLVSTCAFTCFMHGRTIWSGQSQNVRHFGLGDIGEQNCDVKHKQSQLIGMDSVSDICKYHLLCFVTIIEVKVMSGHQVKKGQAKKFRDLELRYMFLGQIFAKNAKNDP